MMERFILSIITSALYLLDIPVHSLMVKTLYLMEKKQSYSQVLLRWAELCGGTWGRRMVKKGGCEKQTLRRVA
jgi:hypothetical protein